MSRSSDVRVPPDQPEPFHDHGDWTLHWLEQEHGYRIGMDLVRGQLRGDELWADWDDPHALSRGWLNEFCACCDNRLYQRTYPNGQAISCYACELAAYNKTRFHRPKTTWLERWRTRRAARKRRKARRTRSTQSTDEQQDFASQIYRSGL